MTLTDLIYGVVIGSTFTRIQRLELTAENVRLVLALVFICDDFLLYHEEAAHIVPTDRSHLRMIGLDMLVLVAWYALVLSAQYRPTTYLFCAALFFCATSVWELAFSHAHLEYEMSVTLRALWLSDLMLALTSCGLAALASYARISGDVLISILSAAFMIWRWPAWMDLRRREVQRASSIL